MEKLLYSANDVAKALNVSRSMVYVLINEGKLRPVHIGRSMRVPLQELNEFVARLVEESRQ
jgi:excisionase family DNA binding protein